MGLIVTDTREYTDLTPDERVAEGAKLLDEEFKGDWRAILKEYAEEIDVNDTQRCPLFFLYGDWWDACKRLGILEFNELGRDSSWYGFACDEDTIAWKRFLATC